MKVCLLVWGMSLDTTTVPYDYDTPEEDFLGAVMDRDLTRVSSILRTGVSIECADRAGKTALLKASRWGFTDMVDLLIAAGASVRASDRWGEPLVRVGLNGYLAMAASLLASGAAVNAVDQDGISALMGASSRGHIDMVRLLLESGADSVLTNRQGATAEDVALPSCRPIFRSIREQALLAALCSS